MYVRYISVILIIFFSISITKADTLVTIESVLTPNKIRLSNNETIVLGGIIVKEEAKNFLKKNYIGKVVSLFPEEKIYNRYQERVAHVKTVNGVWLQKELILNNLAQAFTMPSFTVHQRELMGFEKDLSVLDAQNIASSIEGFQIIEGVVLDVVERGQRVYLNFGEDWRTDFTLSLDIKKRDGFLDQGFDIMGLKSKKIRVRGWLDHYNGPFITLTYPEQIEIIHE